jgi:hypothetical protein
MTDSAIHTAAALSISALAVAVIIQARALRRLFVLVGLLLAQIDRIHAILDGPETDR